MNELDDRFDLDVIKLFKYLMILPILTDVLIALLYNWKNNTIITYFLNAIALFHVMMIFIKYKKIRKGLVCLVTLLVLFLLMNYYIFDNNRQCFMESNTQLVLITCIYVPTAYYISHVACFNSFEYRLEKYSVLGIIIAIVGVLFGSLLSMDNYMEFSIRLLPFACFAYYSFRKNKTLFNAFFSIISFFMLLLFGGRMPLFSFFVFVLFNEIDHFKNDKIVVKFWKIIFVIVCGLIIVLYQRVLLEKIQSIMNLYGMESRNISKILSGNISSSNSRIKIYEYAKSEIEQMGLRIYGIFGDRVILRKYISNLSYVHNIFFEIYLSFGFVFGTVLIIILVSKMIKAFVIKKCDDSYKILLLFMVCSVFFRLLVSGSFITEYGFSLLIGFICNNKVRRGIHGKDKYNNTSL